MVKLVAQRLLTQASILRQAIRARRARKRGEPVPDWTPPDSEDFMLNKLFEKLSGKKVYGIAALGAIAAIMTLAGHPLPFGPQLTDQEAWNMLYTSGLVAAGRSTVQKLIHKNG